MSGVSNADLTGEFRVSDFSLSDLLNFAGITGTFGVSDPKIIVQKTNDKIALMKSIGRPRAAAFMQDVQSQLLQYASGLLPEEHEGSDEERDDTTLPVPRRERIHVEGFVGGGRGAPDAIYPYGDDQTNQWYENEVLQQSDANQQNKITDRKQKIQLYGNSHVPMNREQIATTDTYNVPVKQDTMNPNLKNTILRTINLDSQFRAGGQSATNYTANLNDTLNDTLSMRLYSYQIPYSWYVIDPAYGNTCFWLSNGDGTATVQINVPPGNYTPAEFTTALTTALTTTAGFAFPTTPVVYNSNSGILSLFLDGGVNGSTGMVLSATTTAIIFYDFEAQLQCTDNCSSKSHRFFNGSLGWLMGFRVPYEQVNSTGNVATAILDLIGTKYLILVIDDYNQNHVNNGLVSISQFNNTLKMPSYYSPDLPYTCIEPPTSGNDAELLAAGLSGLELGEQYERDYTQVVQLLPSAPRTLTAAQLYSANAISQNRNNLTNYLAKAPTSGDILAMIPVKTAGTSTGELLVEFSGSLQDNIRTYFGPVNIERLAVRLLDDKGHVINLNGCDWCVTLLCECLYQY